MNVIIFNNTDLISIIKILAIMDNEIKHNGNGRRYINHYNRTNI